MSWEDHFQSLAATHDGLVAKFHLAPVGLDSRHWWRAIRTGRWLPVGDRVLASASAPGTDAQRVMAGLLDASPGAVLHDPTALAWLGVSGFDLAEIHVARARGMSGAESRLVHVHRLRSLRPHDVVVVRGVATETALRAIWAQAARYAGPARHELGVKHIGHLLDRAHRLGLVTWAGLHESVEDLHERGRAGTAIMRELARERPPGSSPTESRLEQRLEEVLADAGVASLARQRVVGGHEPIGRCDFVDHHLPLVVEVNSLTFHTTPTDRTADERRYQALTEAGFAVCVIWEPDLWSRPAAVVQTVAESRHRAAAAQTVVVHSPGCPWPPPLLGTPRCS